MSLIPNKQPENRLLLVDGHGIIYRSFYAIRGLATSDGFPTNAIYGFLQSLKRIVSEFPSTHVVVAMDSRGKTVRHEEFEEYKANRPEMPEELSRQIPEIVDITEKLGYHVIRKERYEADDVIAKLTDEGRKKGMDVMILTGDKDLFQLVDDSVKIVDTDRDNQLEVIGPEEVKEKFGVEPGQIQDFLTLVGDKSDNIPGVPQIGQVRAKKLLNEFGSIERILNALDEIESTRIKNTIADHTESIDRGKSLVALRSEIDLPKQIDGLGTDDPDLPGLQKTFNKLEMASFIEGLSISDDELDWKVIKSRKELSNFVDKLGSENEISLDLETDGLNPINAKPVGISVSPREGFGVYIPVDDPDYPDLNGDFVREKLKDPLEDEKIGKIGQNLKFDGLVLKKFGVDLRGITFDAMISSYLLKPTKRTHNLKEIVATFLGKEVTEFKDLFEEEEDEDFTQLPLETAAPYAVEDGAIIWELKPVLTEKLKDREQTELFDEIEIPLIRVLRDMEFNGIILARDRLRGGKNKLEERLTTLQSEINNYAGEELNPNSPKQVRHVLFDKLDLPVIEKTKTGPSTNAKVLDELSEKHPLPEKIVEYRELSKLLNTYVEKLPEKINEHTGRIHTSFNQTATATGRLSSSDPNLQNIPKGSQLGNELRKAFVAADGHQFIGADYSQVELRLLAHLSGDKELIKTFRKGEDLHTKTAAKIFGVHPEWVDDKMRDRAKRVNFGIVYGITEYGLSRDLGVSRDKAKAYINQFFNLYPGARDYMDELISRVERNHYAETMFNRRRYLPNINSNNWNKRNYDQRNAINTPIQGSAADLIKVAMIDVNRAIETKKLPGDLLLQIHDELIVEVPNSDVEEAKRGIKDIMENSMEFRVPIKVDVTAGEDWSQL